MSTFLLIRSVCPTTCYRCDECGKDMGDTPPERVQGAFNALGFEIITGLVNPSCREKTASSSRQKSICWNAGHFCLDCQFKAIRAVLLEKI